MASEFEKWLLGYLERPQQKTLDVGAVGVERGFIV